ncbi:MAG: SDR family NAD(P)-dependent oxidoreductase [Solirubrobacteraceae bacterium]
MAQTRPETIRSILVLGGSSELGVAIAGRLAQHPEASVVLAGRTPQALERAAARLRHSGVCTVHTLSFEALAPETHQDVLLAASHLCGDRLDVVVVAFGVLGEGEGDLHNPAAAARLAAVNYGAAMSASLAAADLLRGQRDGTIVIISSVAAVRLRHKNFIYSSTKVATDRFAQGLAQLLRASGVRVVIVRPGFVPTQMTAGRKPPPVLVSTPAAVAQATARALAAGSECAWSPRVFRYLAPVIRMLPRCLWSRIAF